jgi:uncharacterized protein (DUF736 family)
MAYTLKPGSGQLFRNDRKQQDTDRDYNGSIVLPDGTEHWFSGWIKVAKTGRKYLSVQIGKPKQEPVARRSLKDDLDGDYVPF